MNLGSDFVQEIFGVPSLDCMCVVLYVLRVPSLDCMCVVLYVLRVPSLDCMCVVVISQHNLAS